MSSPDSGLAIRLTFPDVTLREATELAEELRLELIAAGADSRDIRPTRTSPDSMDLASALLLGGMYLGSSPHDLMWKVAEGAAKELGQRLVGKLWEHIEEFCVRRNKVVHLQHPDGRQLTIGRSARQDPITAGESSYSDTAVVIIIGASRYPSASHLDNIAFSRSAVAAREIFSPRRLTFSKIVHLDLFDVDVDGASLVRAIRQHLEQHPEIRDVVIYYCGHGMAANGRKTALALRGYSPSQSSTTTLRLEDLRQDLEDLIVQKRLYMFFDCCFSGGARDAFQPPNRRFQPDKGSLPERGWAALVASGRDERAISPANLDLTMFTSALREVVNGGIANGSKTLSLKNLDTAMREHIKLKHGNADYELPQSHEYWPEAGYVLDIPLFRNAAAEGSIRAERPSSERVLPARRPRSYALPTKAIDVKPDRANDMPLPPRHPQKPR